MPPSFPIFGLFQPHFCPLSPPPCSSVKVVPVGLSRGLKKLLQEKFPNMNRMEDISELLLQCAMGRGGEGVGGTTWGSL